MAEREETVWISRRTFPPESDKTLILRKLKRHKDCLLNSNVQALVRTRKGYAEQLRNLFAYGRAIAPRNYFVSFRPSLRILTSIKYIYQIFPQN